MISERRTTVVDCLVIFGEIEAALKSRDEHNSHGKGNVRQKREKGGDGHFTLYA